MHLPGEMQNIIGRKTPMRASSFLLLLLLGVLTAPVFAADAPAGEPGREFAECVGCPQMVAIPAGGGGVFGEQTDAVFGPCT